MTYAAHWSVHHIQLFQRHRKDGEQPLHLSYELVIHTVQQPRLTKTMCTTHFIIFEKKNCKI